MRGVVTQVCTSRSFGTVYGGVGRNGRLHWLLESVCGHGSRSLSSSASSSGMAMLILFVAVPVDRGVGVGGNSFSRTRRLSARTIFASIPLIPSPRLSLSTIPSTSSASSLDAEKRNEEYDVLLLIHPDPLPGPRAERRRACSALYDHDAMRGGLGEGMRMCMLNTNST